MLLKKNLVCIHYTTWGKAVNLVVSVVTFLHMFRVLDNIGQKASRTAVWPAKSIENVE